jgi:hypothetical protein
MTTNGGKVGVREFYAELQKQSADRQEMERRLIDAFASGLNGIRDDMRDERDACHKRFGCIEEDVIGLRLSDKKWGGAATAVAAIGTAIAAILGRS